jgi:uncharacterized protein YbaA (DUF1428 family)
MKSKYVDGFLLVMRKKDVAKYIAIAKAAGKVWIDHGALGYCECVGEDLAIKFGVSFQKRAKAKPSETVIFSWVVFKSRAHRDKVNAAVMADPRMAELAELEMPFDMKRMSYGGFEQLVAM